MKNRRKGIRNNVSQWKKDKAKKMAKNMTGAEKELWKILKDKRYTGVNFYKQSIVYGYIIDFYCPSVKLAVEVDGLYHYNRLPADSKRDRDLAKAGIKTLRFKNEEVEQCLGYVVNKIKEAIQERI